MNKLDFLSLSQKLDRFYDFSLKFRSVANVE